MREDTTMYELHDEDAGVQLAAGTEADMMAVVAEIVAAHGRVAAGPLVLLRSDATGTAKTAIVWGDALADLATRTAPAVAD